MDARIASQHVPRRAADPHILALLEPADAKGDSGQHSGTLDARLRRAVAACADDPVPERLLRRYVAYARRYVHPLLAPEAASVLQGFYLSLRAKHVSGDAAPVTTRQLEAMIRLTQARAKVELRTLATEADARFVVDLMRRTILDAATDDAGLVDISRAAAGAMSLSKQVKALAGALETDARRRRSAIFSRDEIAAVAQSARLQITSLADVIDILNQQSYILKRGNGVYKLITSSFQD
jgi:DNA helicase MCM8